jgi:hypothetical protein
MTALAQDGTASLTGRVRDVTGVDIPGALAELRLVHEPYSVRQVNADDSGAYRFSGISAGQYKLKLESAGFETLEVEGIVVSADEHMLLPTVQLSVGSTADCGGHAYLDHLHLLPTEGHTGTIRGIVMGKTGPIPDATAALVCSNRICGETKTDSKGQFTFENLSAGSFAVRVTRRGFYSLDLPQFFAQERFESAYDPIHIERCPRGNCDPRLRPKKPPARCE